MYRVLIGLILLTVNAAGQRSFEVASVRVTPPASLGHTSLGPLGTNRYVANNVSLSVLVQLAYGTPEGQISGIEKLGSEHYDLSAKAEDGVLLTTDQLRPRLQRLLAQRFKLAVHQEEREFDGYALVVAKGGAKLKRSEGGSDHGMIYSGGLQLVNQTLRGLAESLRGPAGRPVVDKTGIAGRYDFTLTYAKDGEIASEQPSLFTAIQEQCGLKLEKAKVPLAMLVIDAVEKVPTEN